MHYSKEVGRNVAGRNVFQGEMLNLIFFTKKVGRNQNQEEKSQGEMSQGEMSLREKCLSAIQNNLVPLLGTHLIILSM